MLQMGQIYGQVSQSSSNGQQASAAAPPFYESAGQNRNQGVEKEKKIITVHATQLGARFLSVAFRVGRCAGVDLHFKQIVTYKNNTLI